MGTTKNFLKFDSFLFFHDRRLAVSDEQRKSQHDHYGGVDEGVLPENGLITTWCEAFTWLTLDLAGSCPEKTSVGPLPDFAGTGTLLWVQSRRPKGCLQTV